MRSIRPVVILASIALLASSCTFFPAALLSIQNTPATSSWWCTATTSEQPSNSNGAYTGQTKGPLTDDDCKGLSAQFDLALAYASPFATVGDAEGGGFHPFVPALPGTGTHHLATGTFTVADLSAPGFDPLDPVFPGSPIDGVFNATRPEILHYADDSPSGRLVGVSWVVRTTNGNPPSGFPGANDWWHRHPLLCVDTTTGAVTGEDLTDAACTGTGGLNLHLDKYWVIDAWIVPGMRHQPDVFAEAHPCLAGPTPIFDPSDACFVQANPEVLRVMVTNDDGIDAAGIDAVVEALRVLPDVEVIVYAPLTNQSGTGDSTTPGGAPPAVPDATASGYPAFSVVGTPADSVLAGLAALTGPDQPDLVISGLNEGQNIGPLSNVSGTVGAAKTAARNGVPALATSQGLVLGGGAPPPDYATGVKFLLRWVREHRDLVLSGGFAGPPPTVESLNIPTCPTGSVRGQREVAVSPDFSAGNPFAVDCLSTATGFVYDIPAFKNGFVTVTPIVVNDAPVANDDVGATAADTPLAPAAPGVLTNDTDDLGDVISVTGSDPTSVEGATVTVNPDGSFIYDPTTSATLTALATGATLVDTFTYTIADLAGATDTASVAITVTGV